MVNSNKQILEVEKVSKHFGGLAAVDKVSFNVKAGEVVGIVGDNAAGKSTLIKMVSGVYKPGHGEIFFKGKDITNKPPKEIREIGIETIYQDLALADNLDASSNIFLGREPVANRFLNTKNTKYMLKESEKTLESLHFKIPNIKRIVRDLSGGQRQGVAISRAIYWDVKLLIMDEPMASLDLEGVLKVYKLIGRLKEKNIAIILITHNLQDIFEVADRVIVLRLGKKVADKSIKDTSMNEVVNLVVGESY